MNKNNQLLWIFLWNIFLIMCHGVFSKPQKPNIVIILADDMGINDVSFHGSNEILTPNIDSLGYHGIILNRYYVPNLCTPSRAALLTGRYPIHTGMQHFVIPSDEPWGLPLKEKLMSEIFQKAGYSTNIVGKWHLGFHKKSFTPTQRGFDYHFGYLGPYIDYFDHSLIKLDTPYARGYDMRSNLSIHYDTNGTYATDVFTNEAVNVINRHDNNKPLFLYLPHLAPHTGNENNPMQALEEDIAKLSHIKDTKRRTYAAMVTRLDEGIGKVVQALSNKNMLDNTIILCYSDNGAPTIGLHSNQGSNYPLRGQKESPWEGAFRSAGVIWSPLLKKRQRVSNQLIHSVDWLPTLAGAAGIPLPSNLKLDGYNLWNELSNDFKSPRTRLLHNIDEINGYSAYLTSQWKYINGTTYSGKYDTWLSDEPQNSDPRSTDYVTTILNTPVSKSLSKFSTKLTSQKIEELRDSSVINCPKTNYTGVLSKYECNPLEKPCLFKITDDPCEYYNLAWKHPNILNILKTEVQYYRWTQTPSVRIKYSDPKCDPALHNYTWTWWLKDDESINNIYSLEKNVIVLILFSLYIIICILIISSFIIFRPKSFNRKIQQHRKPNRNS